MKRSPTLKPLTVVKWASWQNHYLDLMHVQMEMVIQTKEERMLSKREEAQIPSGVKEGQCPHS